MENKPQKSFVIIVSLLIIIILSAFYIFYSIRYLGTTQTNFRVIHSNRLAQMINKNHKTLTSNEVGMIQGWMTFDYVNVLFKLPKNYLKDSLKINNSAYPKIIINRYAKSIGTSTNAFIGDLRSSVFDYFIKK
jgi:hypothetical protein